MTVTNLVLNDSDFGAIDLSSYYDDNQDIQLIQGESIKDDKKDFEFSGN